MDSGRLRNGALAGRRATLLAAWPGLSSAVAVSTARSSPAAATVMLAQADGSQRVPDPALSLRPKPVM